METRANPSPSKPRKKLRLTLGGLILIVALAAVGIYAFLPARTRIIDVKLGTGPAVKAGDTVTLHYVGTLRDGKVFDESKARGMPASFPVGKGQLIKGFDEGLLGMRPGGVRRLIIPPEEAYGSRKLGVIPPNSTLSFEVELLGIK